MGAPVRKIPSPPALWWAITTILIGVVNIVLLLVAWPSPIGPFQAVVVTLTPVGLILSGGNDLRRRAQIRKTQAREALVNTLTEVAIRRWSEDPAGLLVSRKPKIYQ
jgi:hypothetical protein